MNIIEIEGECGSSELALQELPNSWKWMVALGVLLVALGVLGLVASELLSLTSVLMFGGVILAGGAVQVVHAIKSETEWAGRVQHLAVALLYILAGLVILWDPLASSLFFTVLLAALFATIGVTRIWYAFKCKRNHWRWVLLAFSGLLDIILTVIIIATLPNSALWVIGLLVAMEMLLSGWILLISGLRVRRMLL